ncbi:transporter, EamA-like family [Reinekea forsetii]|jgi:drug/metabolite transporter (DMT)-like permease|uniref:Transporter, EamA-like family n=1 Tax=Reinekea forsetii TaxID=1336806 RepID=A0A2K8KTV7_9GAMM|nr:DMT family transporter [Reinekea forsetii]ATX78167.1 transporter, EamA-like family [Reinekea forsetii]
MSNESKAVAFAMAAILLWSTVATAFKIALQYHSVIGLLAGASLTSVLVLMAILFAQGKLLRAIRSFPSNLLNALLLGSLNPVLYYLVLFEAYRRLPAQVAQPVNYTWAITLALLSVPILKHRLTRRDLWGLLLGYSGVVVISIAGKEVTGSLDYWGLALAIFSTLLWAGFWLLNTKKNNLDPIIGLFHNFLVSLPILGLLIWFVPPPPVQWGLMSITSLVYVGLFEMGITFVFWQMALMRTGNAARLGTLIFLSPLISLFLIHLVLKEPLQLATFLGLALIIAGVISSRKKP